ncbi:EamA/RhaT family transporter [Phaeobacter gallaeciensis]|uniref:EamA/RhaT family transporter n=2 Tax=Roseobacteraceae TaxID=2854170 RepID=A0A366X7U8_9RHOB|nr:MULTISPECIES: DMT family transporter [Roseobacteraceae]MBT3142733.1 DMT family transporter [Falsiruegeria litorea]MBT8168257.1 DMT family transporter [Falsiruegeria litorea]RBW61517.1 EamA/RhaT family transporter [Phaeobacter gallaeciensis]
MFEPKAQNPALAALLIFIASAFIAGTTLFAKALGTETLGPPLSPFQISHGRFLFAFMAIATAVAVMRPPLSRPHWRLHIGRTLFGWGGVTLMFASVAFIPMSDATAISFLNPVFAMVLAIPLLGERVGRWRWSAAGIALIGAVILLRPTPDSFQPAAFLALGAAVIMGLELIIIKKLSGRESPFQILLVNNALGLGIATLAVLPVWQMPTLHQWMALVGIGLLMACAQACFVNAMARADASFVAPFSYATLIFAALYDFAGFDVIPDAISLSGAVIILSGALLLAWREGYNKSLISKT